MLQKMKTLPPASVTPLAADARFPLGSLAFLLLGTICASAVDIIDTTPPNNQAGLVQEAGQTFTTGTLGEDNQLESITIITPSTIGGADPVGPFTLKLFTDTDGDFSTWDPGTEVAVSTNTASLAPAGNLAVQFDFSGEVLSDNTVYVFSFNNATNDHAPFRAALTNAGGVAITDGALFSAGAQPFGGAFDVSFVVSTNAGIPPKEVAWTAATDGNWDTATSNWKLLDNSPATFANDDLATFDDTAANGNVTVGVFVAPGNFTVNNDGLAYTIGGAPLVGSGLLTKQGPGSLTLTADHAYSGGTTIEGGTLTAGDGATAGEIGEGPVSIATGASLVISRSDTLDYKAKVKLRQLSGAGELLIDGGGLFFTYPGGGTGFNAAGTWADFSGDVRLINGSEWQSIRNGATSHGTGTLILGDAETSGSLSGIEGNWTWTNPIEAAGPDNFIRNRATGNDRSLKLQGAISGAGNLTLQDATGAMNDTNRGMVITNDVTLGGTLTIGPDTPVRIGGVPGEADVIGTGLNADAFGSLGTTTVVNNGTLTFSRTDTHSIGSDISGTGSVRIGIPSDAGRGDTSTQVVTIADSAKTYSGSTLIESGTLLVNGSLPNSLVNVNPEGTLGGTGTISESTTIFGNLAPGASVGTLSFDSKLLFVGDSSYTWEISDFTGTTGSGYDTTTAQFIEFVDSGLSDPATAATPITIVVSPLSVANFSETNTTFTLATSTNAITVINLDAVVIDDSAFAAATGSSGTWGVQLSADSLSLELTYTAGTPPDDFATWIGGFPGAGAQSGFGQDPDGDGIDNGVENFLGSAPDVFNAGLTIASTTGSSVTAAHTQTNTLASDVTGGYEWSSDLVSWNASGATDGNGVTATINAVVTDDQEAPGLDAVQVTATVTNGANRRLFLRVTASQSSP